MPDMKLVTSSQMIQIEALSDDTGVSNDILMDKAGYQLAKVAISSVGVVSGVKCLVLIGPGAIFIKLIFDFLRLMPVLPLSRLNNILT